MATTLDDSGLTPAPDTRCPLNSTSGTPMKHLPRLLVALYWTIVCPTLETNGRRASPLNDRIYEDVVQNADEAV